MFENSPDTREEWRTSSFSDGGSCVEVSLGREIVRVRDSKNRFLPCLRFAGAEWESFLAGVAAGEFSPP
jgi:hypothetical protein